MLLAEQKQSEKYCTSVQYLWEKHHTFLLELVKLPVAKSAWYLPLALFSLLYHYTELLKLKFATLASALGGVF